MYKNHPNDQPRQPDHLKRYKRFAECMPVSGALRGAVYDLPRNEYKFVPKALLQLLTEHDGKTVADLKTIYGQQNATTIDSYLSFLLQHDYVFWCDEEDLSLFPDIDLAWDAPHHITNLIVDIDRPSQIDFATIAEQVQNLNCQHLQIRCFCAQDLAFWDHALQAFAESVARSIEIIALHSPEYTPDNLAELCKRHLRVNTFIVHSSEQFVQPKKSPNGMGNIAYVTDRLVSAADCHVLHYSYFAVNIRLFTEAQQHHTYFNRKMGIDIHGNIKNCPSLSESFGNINDPDIDLRAIAQSPAFQRLWTVRKDDTAVCRDCEFRYMCVDSREPHLGNDGLYYHRSPCPYDPYTATWCR